MKNMKSILGMLLLGSTLFTSCVMNDDDDFENILMPPTAQEFSAIKEIALEGITQDFSFDVSVGTGVFTTDNGVLLSINGACLTNNGTAVTGVVDIEYVEIFDKGNMLTTNKTTMGLLPDGKKALLISGGEFYVNATQNGEQLATSCGINVQIPTSLTGGEDYDMTLWKGIIDPETGDLAWDEEVNADGNGENLEVGENNGGTIYYAQFGEFGWTNVDRFYNDPRPKTTILAAVPDGYTNENSAIYLSYDGELPALAKLDTYDEITKMFSEHYGQIPIGLECHVIFVSEENGAWRYAIKAVTISANSVITFSQGETAVVTEAQLKDIMSMLP
ncbi:hypothetical protein MWU65_05970 [Cellulophaga sp. F20128]|uniref:hypothetical protein n=1 Tax=Cellulophaga sp. F20128 TaxID=2926413 RepID=UPI001FF4EDA0|nr:hypothetical protein [Cellulophaga sp. F20128]MCK0156717.1 hypothetical protein [Cellulophaga sp. F20128]